MALSISQGVVLKNAKNNFRVTLAHTGMGIWPDAIDRKNRNVRIFIVSTLMTVLVMAFPCGEAKAGSGVVLSLSFEEGEGDVAKDVSPYGNDGFLRQHVHAGAPPERAPRSGPQWEDGKFGKALRFDGVDDYVAIRHSKSLDITDSITIAAWVKLSRWEGQSGMCYLVTKGPLTKTGAYRLGALRNGSFFINIKLPGGPSFGRTVSAKPDFGHACDGEWHHVAGTFDGLHLRLYIDGEEKASKEIATEKRQIISSRHPLAIGGWGYTQYRMAEGAIDEVKIYNVALTEQEILTDMFGGKVMFGGRVIVESTTVNPSEQFTVDISAHLKENLLRGFTFKLTFDPDVLEAISVKEGSLLSGEGRGATSWETPTLDNTNGVIRNIGCRRTGKEGVGDAGVLARVTFRAKETGSTDLTCQDLRLLSPTGKEIQVPVQPGLIDVYVHGSISGVVVDAATEKPVKRAKVEFSKEGFTLGGLFTYCAEDGTYILNGVPVGKFDVTVTKEGFLPQTILKVPIEQGKTAQDIRIKLTSLRDFGR